MRFFLSFFIFFAALNSHSMCVNAFIPPETASQVARLQFYLSAVVAEKQRRDLSEAELSEIRAGEKLPAFTRAENTLGIYETLLDYLEMGLRRKIGLIYVARVEALFDTQKIVSEASARVAEWNARLPHETMLSQRDLQDLIKSLVLHAGFTSFTEEGLIDLFVLKNLTAYQASIFQMKEHEAWYKELENQMIPLTQKYGLYEPKYYNLFGMLRMKIQNLEQNPNTCCGHYCGSCGYNKRRTLTSDKKIEAKLNFPPATFTGEPTLIYYQAKQEVGPLLHPDIFKLHGNPGQLRRAIDAITP
jgi:hypothetical protein